MPQTYLAWSQTSKRQAHKMVKQTQTIRRLLPTNCLSVFDNFMGLAIKGLAIFRKKHHSGCLTRGPEYASVCTAKNTLTFYSISLLIWAENWYLPLGHKT